MEIRRFDKYSLKSQEKKSPHDKILDFSLQDTLKTTFLMENLTQRWTLVGPFLSKIRRLFPISKKRKGRPPPSPPSCVPKILCQCKHKKSVVNRNAISSQNLKI